MSTPKLYYRDDWPTMPDGSQYDGKKLLTLFRKGQSPFRQSWDIGLLIRKVEESLHTRVRDIPIITRGSNFYGIHFKLSNRPDIVARLSRDDANMPNYDGPSIEWRTPKVVFEKELHCCLRFEANNIPTSTLFYSHTPVQYPGPKTVIPKDIEGRQLSMFVKTEGVNNVWGTLNAEQKEHLLNQAARIRGKLFNFKVPMIFVDSWMLESLRPHKPKSFDCPIAPNRDFCISLFTAKINATIKNLGDEIGWEGDGLTVGPVAAAAKQSILRLIPHIVPAQDAVYANNYRLFRLVVEHGDFGIHNMSINIDPNGQPQITSVYDWDTASIVPALLSDPEMAVFVDLQANENAEPCVTRVPENATPHERVEHMVWAMQYLKVLFEEAPEYEEVIKKGKDVRYLWFALRRWRGDDPEGFFGNLGAWAERRLKELGVKEEVMEEEVVKEEVVKKEVVKDAMEGVTKG